LALLGKQTPLVEWAAAAQEGLTPKIDIEHTRLPKGLVIDRQFGAVPFGSGKIADLNWRTMQPLSSEVYAVRCFIQADPSEIPEHIDGVPLFSDPKIDTFPVCSNDPCIGTANDVQHELDTAGLNAAGLDGTDVAVAVVDTGINLAHLAARFGRMPRLDAG